MKTTSLLKCVFFTAILANASLANAAEIRILTAWYGQTCNTAHGNATSHLASACDKKEICEYQIDHRLIGDPAYLCQKNYVVQYLCVGDQEVKLAQVGAEASGKVLKISCR